MGSKIQKSVLQTKAKKHLACSYVYRLVCVDDKFSKPFKTYLSKDVVYFINNMVEESNIAVKWWKKHFNKEPVMARENNKDFKNFTKYWICGNNYFVNDVKIINV